MNLKRLGALLLFLVLVPQPIAGGQPPTSQLGILVSPRLANMASEIEHLVTTRFPHVAVKVTVDNGSQLTDQVTSGNTDLVISSNLGQVRDVLMPLDPLLARSLIWSPIIDEVRFNGVVYGLPLSLEPQVVIYNKDLFERHGLPYPTSDWTWDELLYAVNWLRYASDSLKSGIVLPLPVLRQLWPQLVYQSGQEPLTADAEVLQYALTIASELMLADPIPFSFGVTLPPEFIRGEVPMQWTSLSEVLRQFYYEETNSPLRIPFQWGIVPLPIFPGGDQVNLMDSPLCVGISAFTSNPNIAWQVATTIADEIALLSGYNFGPPALHTDKGAINRWLAQALPFATDETRSALVAIFRRQPVYFSATGVDGVVDLLGLMQDQLQRVQVGQATEAGAVAEVLEYRDALLAGNAW